MYDDSNFKSFDQCLTPTSPSYSNMDSSPSVRSLNQHIKQLGLKRFTLNEIAERQPLESTKDSALIRENELLRDQINRLKQQNFSLRSQVRMYTLNQPVPKSRQSTRHREEEVSLYKEIIQKLQTRVQILLAENSQLRQINQTMNKRCQRMKELQVVAENVQSMEILITKLQSSISRDDKDWEFYKQMWTTQKAYFNKIIDKLEFQIRHQHNH